jgi:phosphoribosylamine--glycine ligase
MRILVIDQDRCGLDFCLRCIAAGHEVKWFRWSRRDIKDGEGFPDLQIVNDWRREMPWTKDGLVITTANNKYLYELDDFRRFGYKNIMAPSVRSAQLEVNRSEGMKLFEQKGLNVAPYKEFKSLQDAKKHVLKTDENYAFKTLGDEEDKSLTFVSSNPAQMAEWLDNHVRKGMVLKGPCILQEKVDFVSEVGVAGWMGPDGFVPDKWEISFEHKKLCSGNYGPNTGEQGTVCQYVSDDPLADILRSFEDDLRGRGHLGDVNINGGVDDKGEFWPFEWTCRLGWPDFFIRTSMHKGDLAEQFRSMLNGRDTMKVSRETFTGVVCSQRPYPYGDGSDDEVLGKPIYGLEDVWDNVHPCQMMMGKGYQMTGGAITTGSVYRTTGPYVLCATGSGKTVSKACDDVYQTVRSFKCSDVILRDDIGRGLERELPILHKLGFAKDVNYD